MPEVYGQSTAMILCKKANCCQLMPTGALFEAPVVAEMNQQRPPLWVMSLLLPSSTWIFTVCLDAYYWILIHGSFVPLRLLPCSVFNVDTVSWGLDTLSWRFREQSIISAARLAARLLATLMRMSRSWGVQILHICLEWSSTFIQAWYNFSQCNM